MSRTRRRVTARREFPHSWGWAGGSRAAERRRAGKAAEEQEVRGAGGGDRAGRTRGAAVQIRLGGGALYNCTAVQ